MPAKTSRSLKTRTSTEVAVDETTNSGSDVDYSALSSSDILDAIVARNKDPTIEKMLMALVGKLSTELCAKFENRFDKLENDKRERSVVISGLSEAGPNLTSSRRQLDLEGKVTKLLDVLDVECRPVTLHRIGKYDPSRNRLVMLELPTRFHWTMVLAKARSLKSTAFFNVYIRKSMTIAERQTEFELRQQAREKNKGRPQKEWVVYKGKLVRRTEIASKQGNAHESMDTRM